MKIVYRIINIIVRKLKNLLIVIFYKIEYYIKNNFM